MIPFKSFIRKNRKSLNPKLWNSDETLKKEVADKLLKITDAFLSLFDTNQLHLDDIVLTGSNSNYNWTRSSDIDLHLLLSSIHKSQEYKTTIEELIQAKKTIWNDKHNISIHNIPVEIYATTLSEKLIRDAGTYSLVTNSWLSHPHKLNISIDSVQVISKADTIIQEIDLIITSQSNNVDDIKTVLNKIAQLRTAGLEENGEYSIENLAFKVIRSTGNLEKIKRYYTQLQDRDFSL